MKKTVFTLAAVLLLFASCDRVRQYLGNAKDSKDDATETAIGSSENGQSAGLQFIHLSYCSADSTVSISADVPASTGTVLSDSIFKYVGDRFEAFATNYSQSHDAQQAFQATGEHIYNQMQSEIAETKAEMKADHVEDIDPMLNWNIENNLAMEHDCEHYVTYTDVGYHYTGGAHGIGWIVGTTFNKETGKRIGTEILKDTDSQAFRTMFQAKLLDYFKEGDSDNTSSTLSEYLLIDVNDLQISNMRITDKDFIFQYQPYEISYYAAGMPAVILTFEQMKPYLTAEGLRLIGE